MKPWTRALAFILATILAALGAARALAGEDRIGFLHGGPAEPGQLLAWPAQPDRGVSVPDTEITSAPRAAETAEPKPAPSAPANPLILPRNFAPQPVHQLRSGEHVALKPWPAMAPTAGVSLPAALPQLSLPVLASLPQGADVSARPKLAPPITITGDNDGWLQTYYLRFRAQVEKGATFRIDGRCASACTLVLAYPERVCATKRAVLGFHEARNRDGTRNQKVTDAMMTEYPEPVRDYIAAHGGLPAPARMMWVSGPALRSLVKPCE
jgi:hypothetical protein